MEAPGVRLKKIRQEKGISLEDVQKKTKIHLNILKAIEGDSLTDLNPVYLKGFLKIYCKFLGLDPKDYISDYKEVQTHPRITQTNRVVWDKPKNYAVFIKNALARLISFRPSKKVISAFIFVLIIVLLSIGLFNLGKVVTLRRKPHLTQKKIAPSVSANKTKPKQEQVLPAPKTIVTTQAKAQAKESMPVAKKVVSSGIRLGMRARENCFVTLKADGRVLFQRILEKGRFESWQAKEKIELSLGNAAAIELEVNGQLFSNLGRKGEAIKNIVITKEGLNIPR